MLRDLTSELMGDPSSTFRRPPTPEEMEKNCSFNRHEFKVRERRLAKQKGYHPRAGALNLPVGGFVIKNTKKQATYTLKNMRNYGLQCHCVPTVCGRYQVIRTA